VIVAEGCVVPDGTVIGYDLEEDQKRYTVTESGVVLVCSEMFETSNTASHQENPEAIVS
jgi:glucose-1-phosphate adenylyltransferase